LTLADLVTNRTMSPEMAATLAVAAEERRSLLFVAIPRMAGKTTTMQAVLQHAPPGTPVHQLSRARGPALGIPTNPDGGYLVMSEISTVGFDDYLWGRDVRYVFEHLAGGKFSLVTALHAGSLEEAFAIIARDNAVPDAHTARLDLMVYIRSLGEWSQPDRRAVAAIYEIEGVENGHPEGRLLHSWSADDDQFQVEQPPLRVGTLARNYERHLTTFQAASR
jgi:type IV secretory pathway ATPase VirB11/archaellum biosynthesis ATPase